MRTKVLRLLVTAKRYANTEKGEKVIVRTLTTVSALLVVDIVLFVVGSINQ